MALNNANNAFFVAVFLGTEAGSKTYLALYLPKRCALYSADLVDQVGFAYSATNYVQVTLQIAGGTPVVLAKLDTSLPAFVTVGANAPSQLVAQEQPESGSEGGVTVPNEYPLDVPAGSVLQAVVAVGGTGTLTGAILNLSLYRL